jgi:hypothetical protein
MPAACEQLDRVPAGGNAKSEPAVGPGKPQPLLGNDRAAAAWPAPLRLGDVGEAWQTWWKSRGEEHLTLLLWAVWDPVGALSLDEYASYAPAVARILFEHHQEDSAISPGEDMPSTAVQLRRNAAHVAAGERLAAHLGGIRREHMNLAPNEDRDQHAAETLLNWYEMEIPEGA